MSEEVTPVFRTRVEVDFCPGTEHHVVHPNDVTSWKTELLENAAPVFGGAFHLAQSVA